MCIQMRGGAGVSCNQVLGHVHIGQVLMNNSRTEQGGVSAVGAVVSVVVVLALVVGLAFLLQALGNIKPTMKASQAGVVQTASGTLKKVSLSLATYPDSMAGEHGKNGGPHPDWVSYGPTTNLWVPAHALVTVTIKNYDTPSTLNSPFYSHVQGTVGGIAYFNGKKLSSINPADVSHTFTIHMFPTSGQQMLDVSVPVVAVPDSAPNAPGSIYPAPAETRFQFVTGGSGRYIWQCFDPCGSRYQGFGGPMSTLGYMSGTITVGSGNNV